MEIYGACLGVRHSPVESYGKIELHILIVNRIKIKRKRKILWYRLVMKHFKTLTRIKNVYNIKL